MMATAQGSQHLQPKVIKTIFSLYEYGIILVVPNFYEFQALFL